MWVAEVRKHHLGPLYKSFKTTQYQSLTCVHVGRSLIDSVKAAAYCARSLSNDLEQLLKLHKAMASQYRIGSEMKVHCLELEWVMVGVVDLNNTWY